MEEAISVKLKEDIRSYFSEIFSLLPKVARLVWLIAQGLVAILITPIYGVIAFSSYLWAECGWSEKLTTRKKIIFWGVVIPLTGGQWFLVVSLINHLGIK
jgi:hypothetical protein